MKIKHILTFLMLLIGSVAFGQTFNYQLNYPNIKFGSSATGQHQFNGNAIWNFSNSFTLGQTGFGRLYFASNSAYLGSTTTGSYLYRGFNIEPGKSPLIYDDQFSKGLFGASAYYLNFNPSTDTLAYAQYGGVKKLIDSAISDIPAAPVTSVNGMTGNVTITDITGNAGSATLWNGRSANFSTALNETEFVSIPVVNSSTGNINVTDKTALKNWLATSLQDVLNVNPVSSSQIKLLNGVDVFFGTTSAGGGLYYDNANGVINFYKGTGGAAIMSLNTSSGNVGIGTTPASGIKFQTRVGTDQNFGILSSSGEVALSAFNDPVNANVPLSFNASAYKFNQGNVLIGTTTDDGVNKLQVNGSAKISGLAGTGDRALLADANGKLKTGTLTGYALLSADNTYTGQQNYSNAINSTNTINVSNGGSNNSYMNATAFSTGDSGGIRVIANKDRVSFSKGGTNQIGIEAPAATGSRTQNLQDKSGTIALTSDITDAVASKANTNGGNTWGGVQIFTNGTVQAAGVYTDSSFLNTVQSNTLTANVNTYFPSYGGVLATVPTIGGTAPTPTGTGIKGQVIITGGYRYECTATNTWVRTAIETTW